jgi:hypothetical protein
VCAGVAAGAGVERIGPTIGGTTAPLGGLLASGGDTADGDVTGVGATVGGADCVGSTLGAAVAGTVGGLGVGPGALG